MVKHHLLGILGAVAVLLGAVVDVATWMRWPIIAIGLILLIADLASLLGVFGKRFTIWRQTGPIGWDLVGFIGGSRTDGGPMQVQLFQAGGLVRKATTIENSYVQSHAGELRSEALMSAEGGYLRPRALGQLAKGTRLRVQASFGGNLEPSAGGTLSIPESEFTEKWPGFTFVVEYEGGARFIQNFTPQDIKDCLDKSVPRRQKAVAALWGP